MSFRKILAAVDHGSLSRAVFNQALDLAQANQAELLLFHCLTADVVPSAPPFAGELGLSPQLINQAYQTQSLRFEDQMRHMQQLLQQYRQLAIQQGVTATVDWRTVEPGLGLCQAAQRWQADLIIMGRRGRRGITEVLLGSVSNYVLHHAGCAVLVIQAAPDSLPQPAAQNHATVSSAGAMR